MLIGGGRRRYCGERAGANVNFFGAREGGVGGCRTNGLGGTSFGGKSSWGERVMAGKLRDLFTRMLGWEMGGAGEICGGGGWKRGQRKIFLLVFVPFLARVAVIGEGANFSVASTAWDEVGILVRVVATLMKVSVGADSAFFVDGLPVAAYGVLS